MKAAHRMGAGAKLAFALLLCGSVPAPAIARKAPPAMTPAQIDEVRRALDEDRLLDAGKLIDEAALVNGKDPQVHLLAGELGLAGGRYSPAIAEFKAALSDPASSAEASQGQGLALMAMGRPEEAVPLLQTAVKRDTKAWRAWNALGAYYDAKRDWTDAEGAYASALTTSSKPAIVLNNRGYSRMLQGKTDLAVSDFVAALQGRPDFIEARANLRLALALKGDYDRALAGANDRERGALLNNAGFAAGMRGDYAKAQEFLKQAMEARGEFFQRASANLKLVEELQARDKAQHDAR